MFETENEMSILFEKFFRSTFGNAYIKECKGLSAIPDFVCYVKEPDNVAIISFELKLINWRKAAKQAFRHKSFAEVVYVVLDRGKSKAAVANLSLFEQYNIGLAVFDNKKNFEIINKPKRTKPYSTHMAEKMRTVVEPYRKKVKNIDFLME
jgi:hypothetical protein